MSLPSGFSERVKKMSDDEVLAILSRPEDYVGGAVEIASAEASRRGLSGKHVAAAAEKAEAIDKQAAARAAIPLSSGMRLFCFLVPINL